MSDFGKNIMYFDTVTSTFDKLLEFEPENGLTVVAKSQTGGVGRLGREWLSDEGGLYFSFYILPDGETDKLPFLAIICALAAYRALSGIVDCGVKWPNDIVSGGKKICGILTKSSISQGKTPCVMAGIGINVNNTSFEGELSDRATSVRLITGREEDINKILESFFVHFDDIYVNYTREETINEYSRVCVTLGKEVAVHYNVSGETKTGKCIRVCEDGTLDVKTEKGVINVNSGEVSVRGIYGYV